MGGLGFMCGSRRRFAREHERRGKAGPGAFGWYVYFVVCGIASSLEFKNPSVSS